MNRRRAPPLCARFGGGITQHSRELPRAARIPWLDELLQDIRFATRQFARKQGFALVAIFILALGIGANAAIFTLTHALLLSGLPVSDPGRLVRVAIHVRNGERENNHVPLSVSMIEFVQKRADAFSGVFRMVGVRPCSERQRRVARAARRDGEREHLRCAGAAGQLRPADDQPHGGPDGWAAVISYRLWMDQFHGDPTVVGRRHVTVTDHGATGYSVSEGFEGVIVAEHPDLPVSFPAL